VSEGSSRFRRQPFASIEICSEFPLAFPDLAVQSRFMTTTKPEPSTFVVRDREKDIPAVIAAASKPGGVILRDPDGSWIGHMTIPHDDIPIHFDDD
jgi:hypothetical protein